eukprot:CAMPEP_0175813892 /NCGR_PEP_ID=MMETSP0107_2-20121207/5130_1 /TAXON_ID=195067 ORGANISM="Goniomonas pacifica, Strain CCMP1869" /NCGR_SAMPLE_ID=MMETSP0107_2 /ASSEMBLY_ACC=CAM_ASM_000203 /LENGTH=73 /DNA_ID=CAMNT_0017125807 /DNA_START=146 /DNA_END=367 /DNA_ORIENTATION=+
MPGDCPIITPGDCPAATPGDCPNTPPAATGAGVPFSRKLPGTEDAWLALRAGITSERSSRDGRSSTGFCRSVF